MLKLLFDNQIFLAQSTGGISRLFAELYSNFKLAQSGIRVSMPFSFGKNVYAKNVGRQRTFLDGQKFKGENRIKNTLNKYWMISQLKINKYDIFHPTYYNPYFIDYIGKKPFILTIFDMIHEIYATTYFQEDTITSKQKKYLVEKAKRIIAISESTKNDIIKIYKINPDIIDVVYLGCSIDFRESIKCPDGLINKKYLLFVGNRGLYKNFNMFVRSIAPLLKKYEDINVVCIGGGSFTKEECLELDKYGVSNKFIQKLVFEEELISYYHNAIAFIYPSLYEGFGIPLLEAFSSGCPVIASDIPVFREVAGNAVLYFNPEIKQDLTEQIEKILNSTILQGEYTKLGYEQIKKYSWNTTAKMTEEVYLKAI
jgi:glycosyltransferase involved in cell wall biosynthesis